MDAVFTKNTKGLFSDPPTPKSHYHPTTPRAQAKSEKQITLTLVGSVEPSKPSHTLTPIQQPRTVTQSPPTSRSHWDVKVCPSDTWGHGSVGLEGSPGSSKFDESWPSTSEGYKGQNTLREQEVEVGSGYHVEGGPTGGHLGMMRSDSQDSTLGRYVERFRRAPPTSRASRDMPPNPFWWKSEGKEATPLQDFSTPPSKGGPYSHSPTHTDPSPRVSGEPSLDSRSQDLIEKSLTVLSTSESPPAQKYLNTLAAREAQAGDAATTERGTGNRHSRGSVHVQFAADSAAEGGRVQAPPTTSSSDILAEWRLRRRLEQARGEASNRVHSLPLDGEGPLHLRYGYRSHHSAPSQFHEATPLQYVNCRGEVLSRQQASVRQEGGARVLCGCGQSAHLDSQQYCPSGSGTVLCGCGKGRGMAEELEKGKERVKLLREQDIQTSPGLLATQDVQHVGDNARAVRGSVQGRARLEENYDNSVGHTPQNYSYPGTIPTEEIPSSVEEEEQEIEVSPRELRNRVPPPHTSYLVMNEQSRQEQESLVTPTTTRESRVKAPPTHGGLALRDMTLPDDPEFTMTLNYTDTDLDTSMCYEQHAPSMSTPTYHRYHDSREHNSEGTPPGFEPALSQEAPTSKGCVTPPQREGELENGFSWDDDMGDELLKLLIAKAKLFEVQIRKVDEWLMALETEEQ